MAEPITNVLGTVAIKHCGEYDATMHYEKLNVVTYNGSSYCAKDNTIGNLPTNTTYWDLMAEKGDKGDKGDTPVKGTDYYTAADKADLERTLSSDVSTEVESQLSTLSSATPLVASSTSEMTDTTRIYVNSTNGHWYWYNGTGWVDGGVYQATGIDNDDLAIDGRNAKTSNLAMYYGYEELAPINDVYTFEHGDISGSIGSPITFSNQQWRQRTPENSPILLGIGEDIEILNLSNDYLQTRIFTTDLENNLTYVSNWGTQNRILHGNPELKYYLLIQVNGHYNWDVSENELAKIRIIHNKILYPNYIKSLFTTNVYNYTQRTNLTLDSSTRCLTDYISYSGKIKIKGPYQWLVTYYNKTTKEYVNDLTGWKTDDYVTFNSNYLYKIAFKKSDETTITPSEVKENMYIYPIEGEENQPSGNNYNLPNCILNSHQGYSDTYTTAHDLAEGYFNSFLKGYKMAETDIKFTSDNVPVCSHNSTFISGGVEITIQEHTYQELLTYDYFNGSHISSLDEVMANCKKYGLILQLDQLAGDYTEIQWNAIFDVINKYQMRDFVCYSGANNTIIRKILSYDKKATFIMNATDLTVFNTRLQTAIDNKNDFNKFIIAINYESVTPEQIQQLNKQLVSDVYIGVYTIDNLNTLLSYLPYVYMISTNKITNQMVIDALIN